METNQKPEPVGRWSQQRRLRLIDFRLAWDGTINRVDVRKQFGVSTPQASADIGDYNRAAPGNMEYNKSSKVYVASQTFQPIFSSSGPEQYLAQLMALSAGIVEPEDSPLGYRPPTALVPVPMRLANGTVLKELVRAIAQNQTLEVDYQSIARDEQRRRLITPHAFARDGLRWHVRAYCHIRRGYRDFVIGRVLSVHGVKNINEELPEDAEWVTHVDVVLVPHPELSPNLQEGVRTDFNMSGGHAIVRCRQALLFYLFKSLGLTSRGKPYPEQRQVVVQNLEELREFLPRAGQP